MPQYAVASSVALVISTARGKLAESKRKPGQGTSCGCFGALLASYRMSDEVRRRHEFERTIRFLTSVPIFRSRLPRSELPRVAQLLQRSEWAPGRRLIRQGDTGRAFFLIESGEAEVITAPEGGGPERVRAILVRGDYFGGHTLTTVQRNVATIAVGGSAPLVTLSMSRSAFEKSGLRHLLYFPKRPVIYEDRPGVAQAAQRAPCITDQDAAFIRAAIHNNTNLRALLDARGDEIHDIAQAARRRVIPAGTTIASVGDSCRDFFVVREGSVRATFADRASSKGQQQCAEAAVSHSTMAERMLRKQNFLRSLSSSALHRGAAERRHSMSISGRSWQEFVQQQQLEGAASPAALAPPGSAEPALHRRPFRQPRQGTSHLHERPVEQRKASKVQHEQEQVVFHAGECFGELSALYGCQWLANFTALEDVVAYALDSRHFKRCFYQAGELRLREYCELLEEVHLLTALVGSERWELACNAGGLIEFRPGERVIHQGKVREARQWYIVFSGTAVMSQDRAVDDGGGMGEPRLVELGRIGRGTHFGERSLLRHMAASEINVDAGPSGMCCLVFDFERTRVLLERIFQDGDGLVPSLHSSIDEWCRRKAEGWGRMSESNRRGSSYSEEHIELADLQMLRSLGRGAYGVVKLAEHVPTRKRYALKIISKESVERHHSQRHVSWERELMLMVDSPFVVRLYRTFRDAQSVYFLLEAALGGTLLELLHRHTEIFSEDIPRGSSTAFYIGSLVSALEHLHERKIVHRDVKPENVLLDGNGYAKLGDMGFARFILGKSSTLVGTPDYMAPEMIDFPHTHTVAVDWWALGVVTYELLTGQVPFEDAGVGDQMARLVAIRRSQEHHRLEFPFYFPSVAKGFVRSLLQKMPFRLGALRDADEVRSHGMFAELGLDFEALHNLRVESPLRVYASTLPDGGSVKASTMCSFDSDGTWEASAAMSRADDSWEDKDVAWYAKF